MTIQLEWAADDTSAARKSRGAFFTPEPIARYVAEWAIRSSDDRVMEPSSGDSAFMVQAVTRLRSLGARRPVVDGVEIHEHSARVGRARVEAVGGEARIQVSDFFSIESEPEYDAVVGNPPYVRYQDWTGQARLLSRSAAVRAGVALSGLASSWAHFTVQSTTFLRKGGRLGLVLPAELLSVNYAGPVREFLFENFRSIDLLLFERQVFEEAEADTLLLLADGFGDGRAAHATVRQARDAASLSMEMPTSRWTPTNASEKWSSSLGDESAPEILRELTSRHQLINLETWGDTTLGMVTGNNRYFALTSRRVRDLGLESSDLIRLSPPGSSHLRRLSLTGEDLRALDDAGHPTWLFRPEGDPSPAGLRYISAGETSGVNNAYKCRVRRTWYRVPLVAPADLFLTYMNAEAVQLSNNSAGAHHVNSVHGVYLRAEFKTLGKSLLPLAALNSASLLSAELVGRSYGGGVLKMEPREADVWLVPSPRLVKRRAEQLRAIRRRVLDRLSAGKLDQAVELVDAALFDRNVRVSDVAELRTAHQQLQARRAMRGRRG